MAARFNLLRLAHQAGKLGEQFEGQIIDRVIAEILEGLEGRGFPRAGDAGDNDQFLLRAYFMALGNLAAGRRLGVRVTGLDAVMGPSYTG